MIRRNILKLLGALSLVPVLQVSASETYMGAKIIRLEADSEHVFRATTKVQDHSGEFVDGPRRIFCVMSIIEDKEHEVWCPLMQYKESEKELLEIMFSKELFSVPHNYCHIIKYKNLVGYLCTSEPFELKSTAR